MFLWPSLSVALWLSRVMQEKSRPVLSNVKARFRVSTVLTIKNHQRNFEVHILNHYKFIVFHGSAIVNVTGIRQFEDIDHAVKTFCQHFHCIAVPQSVVVDNSTATGHLPSLNHHALIRLAKKTCSKKKHYTISCRTHYFPCVLIRLQETPQHSSLTLSLFASGKFNILAAKTEQDLVAAQAFIEDLLKQHGKL